MTSTCFKNHFLVAMPGLADHGFQQSVTYICEHHKNGAMGIIINHPLQLTMKELFGHLDMEADCTLAESPIYYGGPVQKERGFVLHSSDRRWETTMAITEDLSLTGSRDILADIAIDKGPQNALVALGYAGWDAGQLETEIGANSWLTVPADNQIIFEVDCDRRWTSAAGKLGIDVKLMTGQAGHS